MTDVRLTCVAIVSVLGFCTTALAKDEWKTVTLGGDANVTIDIPAAVTDYSPGKNPDDLMFFSATTGLHGSLVCMANRMAYPKDSSQAAFAASLATERRNVFCGGDTATAGDPDILESSSFSHNGMPAAVCTASLTDSAQKPPGIARSQLIVAAPRNVYVLTCSVEDEDQGAAEVSWAVFWGEKVRHIQASFRLPN